MAWGWFSETKNSPYFVMCHAALFIFGFGRFKFKETIYFPLEEMNIIWKWNSQISGVKFTHPNLLTMEGIEGFDNIIDVKLKNGGQCGNFEGTISIFAFDNMDKILVIWSFQIFFHNKDMFLFFGLYLI